MSLPQVTLFGKMEVPTFSRTIEDYVTTFTRYRDVSEVRRVILMKFRKDSD